MAPQQPAARIRGWGGGISPVFFQSSRPVSLTELTFHIQTEEKPKGSQGQGAGRGWS